MLTSTPSHDTVIPELFSPEEETEPEDELEDDFVPQAENIDNDKTAAVNKITVFFIIYSSFFAEKFPQNQYKFILKSITLYYTVFYNKI